MGRTKAKPSTMRVPGFTRLDGLDLQKKYPKADISVESVVRTDSQHGELATLGIVVMTLAGIYALGSWLLKNRKNKKIEKTIEIVKPDGSKRIEKIVMEVSESTTDASVVKELAKILDIDLSKLAP